MHQSFETLGLKNGTVCVDSHAKRYISSLREAMKMFAKLLCSAKMKTLTTERLPHLFLCQGGEDLDF